MLPRRLLPWLFALALLLGQATAFAHAIGHLHSDEGDGADPVCELCVAQAQLGHAAPPVPSHLLLPPATHAAPATAVAFTVPLRHHRAHARAPPAPA